MKSRYDIKTAILVYQSQFFLTFALPLYLFTSIAVHMFGLEISLPMYLMATGFCVFMSSIPLNQTMTQVSCLFYNRVNTLGFIKDYLFVRSLLLIFILGLSFLGLYLLSYDEFFKIYERLRFSSAVLVAINFYFIWLIFDITTMNNMEFAAQVKTPLVIIKRSVQSLVFFALLLVSLMIWMGISQPLGGFLFFILFLIYQFHFDLFMKTIIDKNLRVKSFVILGAIYASVALTLSVFEYSKGNRDFVFKEHFLPQIENWFKNASDPVPPPVKEDEITNLATLERWMKQNEKDNEIYAKSFVKMQAICPSYRRINPLTVRCGGCERVWISANVDEIESLSEKDRLERLKYLFETESEYANMVGLAYSLFVTDIPKDILTKIEKIAADDKSNLQYIARNIHNNKEELDKNVAIYFVSNAKTCDENSQENETSE